MLEILSFLCTKMCSLKQTERCTTSKLEQLHEKLNKSYTSHKSPTLFKIGVSTSLCIGDFVRPSYIRSRVDEFILVHLNCIELLR